MDWTDGNIPKGKSIFYWLTIKSTMTNEVYPVPCKFLEKDGCWISFNGERISSYSVVAYCPILKPKPYNTIGSGVGYYIRTDVDSPNEAIYGFGLQPANWVMKGYSTKEKAISAAKRLRKLDIRDERERSNYQVINGAGEVIWNSQ